MGWVIAAALFLSVLKAALCFNIDPAAWKTMTNPAAGFGYQVVQRPSDVLVSAPLDQYSTNGRGTIFSCNLNSQCNSVSSAVPNLVNMSLGLTMKTNPTTRSTLACGPTIPKDCTSITMYNGRCFQVPNFQAPIPRSDEECRSTEVAFLLDGSGSVSPRDFQTMKNFVKQLIRSSLPGKTQFSVSQFSTNPRIHYYFNDFFSPGSSWETNIDWIQQLYGGTYTARAITYVVNNVFIPERGSRPNSKKVLIVITDGESHDRLSLPEAARLAEWKGIVRFAIGVGSAFSNTQAKGELDTIASSPPNDYVFQVNGFDALDKIRQNLQNKIFSIEGSQGSGESLKMEMAQEGFSAAFVPGGILEAVVGANQWRGGYIKYASGGQKISSYEPMFIEPDSYLGYSMAVAKSQTGSVTIVGAPRFQHRGIVLVVDESMTHTVKIDPYPLQQTGEYFGAEVCAMSVSYPHSQYADLILISAPMHKETEREGRVYVCRLINLKVECRFDSPLILKGAEASKGRFGSSLAVLPDLNADGLSELAVGAPLENDGQGSIYIFHGERRPSINPTYSQRIIGSEVKSGLKYFGMSISQVSFDQSGDGLPDLAVGSKGAVVLLRSRPIVMVVATVSFNPSIIPTDNDCSVPLKNTAKICFTMTPEPPANTARAAINYTFTLDATRNAPKNRAYITEKQRDVTGTVTVDLNIRQMCNDVKFLIQPCAEDVVNELSNELRFTFDGLPSSAALKPSLAQQAKTTAIHPLRYEINCGTDNQCVDDLKVDFNFTRSSVVKVGIDELLDVTVSVENRGENSYSSRVILTYPAGLSYRKFTVLQGRIECNSLDTEDVLLRGNTDCTINKPILKSNSKAVFIVSYGIGTTSELDRKLFVTANATSGNQAHAISNDLYKMKEIAVKYSIFVTIESSLSYNNFTYGKSDLQKPVQQSIKVTNVNRVLNFTVAIRVPVKLGDKDIWVDSNSLQIPNCQKGRDEQPAVQDFVAQIQKTKSVDCSVARCAVFKCNRFMGRGEEAKYVISANVSSQWIQQIGLESAKFLLTTTASLEYDKDQYIFISTGSNNDPPVRKIEAEIEVYPEPDFTKEIVGGSLGGLLFLALLTAGLYKAGFFKSKYNQMINDSAEGGEGPGADEGGASPE